MDQLPDPTPHALALVDISQKMSNSLVMSVGRDDDDNVLWVAIAMNGDGAASIVEAAEMVAQMWRESEEEAEAARL